MVMSTRAAATQVIATHGVADIAALDVRLTNLSVGRDMRVGASSAMAQMATVDTVAVGETEMRVDRDGVQVSPCVPALKTEQACLLRWGVACVEEFCGRALTKRLQNGATRDLDLPLDMPTDAGMSERSEDESGDAMRCRKIWL
jgi:hypothetical protein